MTEARSTPMQRLSSLALPIVGLNVLNVLALAVDTAMCGRLPDADTALTALGFATQIIFTLQVAMMGLAVGTVAIVSRARGAGDADRVAHAMRQSTQLTVLLAAGIAGLGALFARPMLELLGARGAALDQSVEYLVPMLIGLPFAYLNVLYAAILRALGDARLAFATAILINAINVAVNYALILGNLGAPSLGVQGAAIGTVVAQCAGVFFMVGLLKRGMLEGVHVALAPRRFDGALVRETLRVGAPAAADVMLINLSFMAIVGMLGHLDPIAVAAHGIGLRVQSLAFMPGLSVSQATGALVGQALGAGDQDEAQRVLRSGLVLGTGSMTALALLILATIGPLLAVFDVPRGTPLWDLSAEWIRLLGFGMPLVGLQIVFVGLFRGAGASRISLGINLVVTLLFLIPACGLLGFAAGWGPFGVWVAFPISFGLKAVWSYVSYRRGDWARVGLHAA